MANLTYTAVLQLSDRISGPAKRAAQSTGLLARRMAATQSALKDLTREQRALANQGRTLAAYDAQERGLADLARQANATRGKLADLQRQLASAADGDRGGLAKALTAETRALERLERKQQKLANTTRNTRAQLRSAGVDHQSHARRVAETDARVAALNRRLERQARVLRLVKGVGRGVSGTVSAIGRTAGAVVANVGLVSVPLAGMVRTAAEFERMEAILTTIEGSSDKAKISLAWVSDFAARTPYDLAGVSEAFVRLKSYGLDPTDGTLRTLGDTAAAMGKDVMDGVEALADALTGENERLKEFGIKARKEGARIVYEYTANGRTLTRAADANNREMIAGTLKAIWNEKYSGAMDRLSRTWGGMLSNLGDQFTRFQLLVMESGAFDALKARLDALLTTINAMAADGRLQAWAERVGEGFRRFIEGGGEALTFLGNFGSALRVMGAPLVWFGEALGTAAGFLAVDVPRAARTALDAIQALPGEFTRIGGAIWDGLKAGMAAKWEALKAWVADKVAALGALARGALGIKSPSRVFAEIGRQIPAGLAQGIAAGAGAPVASVRAITGRLRTAGAGIALAAGAAALSPAAAAPITIHVHGAPGQSPEAIAQAVRRELAAVQAQQTARGRARLFDAP